MFRMLRRNMKMILLGTAILIVPPFAIWGLGTMGDDAFAQSVGSVYGKKVTVSDYLQARDACMLNLYLLYGPDFRDLLPMVDINSQTWDRMLLRAKAARMGVRISDAEVARQIEALFRDDEGFDPARYKSFLHRAEIPALVFERRVRDTLAIGRLTRLVTDTAIVGEDELREAYLDRGKKVTASYVRLEPKEYLKAIQADEEKVREYYEANPRQFRLAEEVKVRYVVFSPEDFSAGVGIAPGEVENFYEVSVNRWKDESGEPLPLEEATPRIEEELRRNKAKDLAFEKAMDLSLSLFDQPDLAKAAAAGGLKLTETDFFSRANPPSDSAEFARAAFATMVRANSAVLKTAEGFVILSPLEKRPARVPELEEVHEDAARLYREQAAQDAMLENADAMRARIASALTEGKRFEEIVGDRKVRTLGPVGREDSRPGLDPLKQACLNAGDYPLTPVVRIGQDAYIGYVRDREATTLQGFEEARPSLRLEMLAKKRESLLTAWFKSVRAEADLRAVDEKTLQALLP